MSLVIKPTAKANLSWWGWFAIALAFGPFIAKRAILLLERLRLNASMMIVTSAAIFALIHLTSGLDDTLNAFLSGLLLGVAYWQTRRLSVCIVSHYLADFYVFSGWAAFLAH